MKAPRVWTLLGRRSSPILGLKLQYHNFSLAFLLVRCSQYGSLPGGKKTPRFHKVTPDSQVLLFKRYNTWWGMNAKKVKASMRSRLRWNEESWSRATDQACLVLWCANESRNSAGVSWIRTAKGRFV